MTTWLDWRTEPVAERPEIEIKSDCHGQYWVAICPVGDCYFRSESATFTEVDDEVSKHQDWHENGMPQ